MGANWPLKVKWMDFGRISAGRMAAQHRLTNLCNFRYQVYKWIYQMKFCEFAKSIVLLAFCLSSCCCINLIDIEV